MMVPHELTYLMLGAAQAFFLIGMMFWDWPSLHDVKYKSPFILWVFVMLTVAWPLMWAGFGLYVYLTNRKEYNNDADST